MRSDRVQTVSFARRTIGGTEHQSRERASVKKSFMLLYLLSFGTFNELPVPGNKKEETRTRPRPRPSPPQNTYQTKPYIGVLLRGVWLV